MEDTHLVVVTTPDDYGGTHTGYVGGITTTDLVALTANLGPTNVTPVDSVPYDLVSGEACAYLVGTAEAMGLRWQLVAAVEETPAGPEALPYLRVYDGGLQIIAEGQWRGGEWVGGSHTTPADAAHYLTWYRARKEAEKDA